MKFPLCLLSCLMLFLLCGCDNTDSDSKKTFAMPPVGEQCKVQLRRNALGGATSPPVSPFIDNINGADVSISGKIKAANSKWIVLERPNGDIWIPQDVVLLIQFSK